MNVDDDDIGVLTLAIQYLATLKTTLDRISCHGEAQITEGLRQLVAALVEGETTPDSPEHAIAQAALNPEKTL
jgi:hypothetical protein